MKSTQKSELSFPLWFRLKTITSNTESQLGFEHRTVSPTLDCDLVWSGLIWTGKDLSTLNWSCQDLSGLLYMGLVWTSLVCTSVDWSGMVWTSLQWSELWPTSPYLPLLHWYLNKRNGWFGQVSYDFTMPHSRLTLSLLAPGLDRSWSECCWFQLEPVGPDMLRPTPG